MWLLILCLKYNLSNSFIFNLKIINMFRKPIKIKSNTPVKSSERKNIKDKIHKQYPILTEEDLNYMLPKKEALNNVKIVTASDETVLVYTIQKRPICFELYGKVFPTLNLLWQFPKLVHNFTTHKEVMEFINAGADLMLPGVLTPPPHTNLSKYGVLQKEDIVAINLSTNKASFAVGTAVMSSAEMGLTGGKGKCVKIIHFLGDKLCTLEGQSSLPLPNMGPPDWLKMSSYEEDFPSLGSMPRKVPLPADCDKVNNDLSETEIKVKDVPEEEKDSQVPEEATVDADQEITQEEMDELLHSCFFTAIKYSKTLTLPILTSNFYKLQVLAACPPHKNLDIKKSSFKKLKPFLDKMCQDNIISVKEIKKGVESVVAINKNHPKFESFYVKPEDRPGAKNQENSSSDAKTVIESYIITQAVLPIFSSGESKLHKGMKYKVPRLENILENMSPRINVNMTILSWFSLIQLLRRSVRAQMLLLGKKYMKKCANR
ncbi:hypothetical protein HHI36_022844 [Cryptolaemus montrouzieri]|uniref:Eukaryotic translation initiation factor 2D n=1 Tax=Cryptolaemus montrouzieri TaxID=559131 RepID=A0ABD2PF68_9CUCU